MQIYALDESRLISALEADKGKNYLCPQCVAPVRVRQGDYRQSHFFHLSQNSRCRQSQKGEVHLTIQKMIHHMFPGSVMEKPYPEIGRIADVADEEGKVIYEIQYSPISLREAKERSQDYESLGYSVVWLLHQETFNREIVTPGEFFLRTKTCYYTNIDEKGNGVIFDQLDSFIGKKRAYTTHLTTVSLRQRRPLPPFKWPKELAYREIGWALMHQGDVCDMALKGKFFPVEQDEKISLWNQLKEIYLTALHLVLSRSAK